MTIAGSTWLLIASLLGQTPGAVEFRLQDHRGAWHSLDEAKGARVVVLAFVGAECPLARAYAPKLAELAGAYRDRGVAFYGVDSNDQDGPGAIERFAREHAITFPILKDVGHPLADRLGAERTPEVFVLDEGRAVRYRGRIDDQYALGVHRAAPTTRELAGAIDALLAGQAPPKARGPVSGCLIGRSAKPAEPGPVTYAKDVAPILQTRCVSCHKPGEIAPFALTDYRQAAGWSAMIAEVVHEGRMPPWHASPDHGRFANDARLTPLEKKVVADWFAGGAPQGNPADSPPSAPSVEGWRIPSPDLVVAMPQPAEIPAEGSIPYQHVVVDPKLTKDVWVRASQVRPGNPSVLHHLVVYVLPPGAKGINDTGGDFLAAYAPGMPPRILPQGVARRIPAGSKLLLQIHYTPNGTRTTDLSQVGLTYADPSTVRQELKSALAVDFRLAIPPGAADYRSAAKVRFDQSAVLHSLMPHMHLRGKAMRFEARYPDGRREILLDVPRYEFDWQNLYVLAEPKPMPEGTVIRCEARFDNSAANLNNPDPTRRVTFGEQTEDEMLVGYLNYTLRDQDLALGLPTSRPLSDGRFAVTFRHRPDPSVKSVALACKELGWEKNLRPMAGPDPEGRYSITVELPPGQQTYKFVLDGQKWVHDPGNPEQNGYFHDSVIAVGVAKTGN